MVALAEFQNRGLTEEFGQWGRRGGGYPIKHILGYEGLIGGATLQCLILLGLNSRAISLSSEALDLLCLGHSEAAGARARSLYELTVVTGVITGNARRSRYETVERYYISTILDKKKQGFLVTADGPGPDIDSYPDLEERAKQEWGINIKKPNDWARKALGKVSPNASIAFRELERAAGCGDYHHVYVELNNTVHADAGTIVRRHNFERSYLNQTRAEYDPILTRQAAWAVARFLSFEVIVASIALAVEMGRDWEVLSPAAEIEILAEEILGEVGEMANGE